MSDVIYRPGEWQVVVEDSGIAALPSDAGTDKVVALSEMLRNGVPALTEVIDVLSGGAITGLGSFAVALIGPSGTRFAVRGAVDVVTGLDEGFSGEDITTWSERYIAGEPRFEIRIGAAADAVEYPIRSGVVLASGIRVGEVFTAPQPDAASETDQGTSEEADGVLAVDGGEPADVVMPTSDVEPEIEPEQEAGPEPELEPEAEPEPEVEPEPEPESDLASPSETITPDQMLLARGAAGQPDDAETAAPASAPDVASPHVADTMAGLVTPEPPALPPLPSATEAGGADDIGDHDGSTISVDEARRLRAAAVPTSAPDAPTEALPMFDSAPHAASGARIRLSTGQVVELDRTIIIGRKPRSTRASESTMPHLIAVDSPQSDISRNHLEVRPEGDSVVVIDLHTTNGSTLLRPGAEPMRLHPGEQTLVLHGDVIDVGDGVTVTVEEL